MSCMSMFYKLSINQPLIFTHCQRNHPTSAVKIALQSGDFLSILLGGNKPVNQLSLHLPFFLLCVLF